MYERAMRTRSHWKTLSSQADFWFRESGSLHIATTLAEAELLGQMTKAFGSERGYRLQSKREAERISPMVQTKEFVSAMYSPNEALIDSPMALDALSKFLEEQDAITFVR
jgi:glycine/D-amino acid oxidase-like deaminating enzyme